MADGERRRLEAEIVRLRRELDGQRAAVAEEIAQAIEAADTSGWPGGRGSDVDGCQELAARIARDHGKEQ